MLQINAKSDQKVQKPLGRLHICFEIPIF